MAETLVHQRFQQADWPGKHCRPMEAPPFIGCTKCSRSPLGFTDFYGSPCQGHPDRPDGLGTKAWTLQCWKAVSKADRLAAARRWMQEA
eukprot:5107941-Alexandrium_andersonii.AAC.1